MMEILPKNFGDYEIPVKESIHIARKTLPRYISNFFTKKNGRKSIVYCVGLPRSGTTSIADIVKRELRAEHEPDIKPSLYMILKYRKGNIKRGEMKKYLEYRDRSLNLELESSHFLYNVVDILEEINPEAKFIFTVREPLSWIESAVNKTFEIEDEQVHWRAYREEIYGRYRFEKEENIDNNSEFPIRSYLEYWREHVKKVMGKLDEGKVLVVKTSEIDGGIEEIMDFIDLDVKTEVESKNSNRRKGERFRVSGNAGEEYIKEMVNSVCGSVWDKYIKKD